MLTSAPARGRAVAAGVSRGRAPIARAASPARCTGHSCSHPSGSAGAAEASSYRMVRRVGLFACPVSAVGLREASVAKRQRSMPRALAELRAAKAAKRSGLAYNRAMQFRVVLTGVLVAVAVLCTVIERLGPASRP
jgi:hypothetical protein